MDYQRANRFPRFLCALCGFAVFANLVSPVNRWGVALNGDGCGRPILGGNNNGTMHSRTIMSLNGTWACNFDVENVGKQNKWSATPPEGTTAVTVPGIWRLHDPDYTGVVWYFREFRVPLEWRARRVFLRFLGVNYFSEVWLNGKQVGEHEGGYLPFEFEVSKLLDYGSTNRLAVRVLEPPWDGNIEALKLGQSGTTLDGWSLPRCAGAKETWHYQCGGIWDDVILECRPHIYISDVFAVPARSLDGVTVQVTVSSDIPFNSRVNVGVLDDTGKTVAETSTIASQSSAGDAGTEVSLSIPDPKLWTIESPYLYRCRASLENGDTVEVPLGLRRFESAQGKFYLNGKEIILKGAFLQPNYPMTLIAPTYAEMAEKDVRGFKECGFNLLRSHVRPLDRTTLGWCDKLGLMVLDESALGWIQPRSDLLDVCHREMREVIHNHRNHPSVVMWGVWNENLETARLCCDAVLREAGKHDPTRPIVGNSGAVALAPFGGWVDETKILPAGAGEPIRFEDIHIYADAPLPADQFQFYRTISSKEWCDARKPPRMAKKELLDKLTERLRGSKEHIFLSEYGAGGMMDFWKVCDAYGNNTNLIDYREYKLYRDRLERDFNARNIKQRFGTPQQFIASCQELHAIGNRRVTEAIRLNPLISGYVLTQWNDVSFECDAGVVDPWRNPKKVFDTMRAVNAETLIVAVPETRTPYPGTTIIMSFYVVDDGSIGNGMLRTRLVGPKGKTVKEAAARIEIGDRIVRAMDVRWQLADASGWYNIEATLESRGKIVARMTDQLFVPPSVDLGETAACVEFVGAAPGALKGNSKPNAGVLAVNCSSGLSPDEIKRVKDALERGRPTILFCATPETLEALKENGIVPRDCELMIFSSGVIGHDMYAAPDPIFDQLAADGVLGEPYAELLPDFVLKEVTGWDTVVGCVTHSMFRLPKNLETDTKFLWSQIIARNKSQKIFVCQLPLLRELGHNPMSDALFSRLIEAVCRGDRRTNRP